jgi:D-apiose dehydrogenase
LCQKPLTPTYGEAQVLAAEIGGRIPFMVHENWRFRPQYRKAAEWIAEGRVGPVRLFAMSALSSGLIRRPGAALPPALERQPFMARLRRFIVFELLIHHLDVVRFLVGQRLHVAAATLSRRCPDVVGEDTAHIVLRGDGGAAGSVTGSFLVPGMPARVEDRLEIVGESGRILFDGGRLAFAGAGGEEAAAAIDLDAAYQASYDAAIAHFVDRLRTGRPFETAPTDNLETLRLVDETYAAAGMAGTA